jgi:hypothetical protein
MVLKSMNHIVLLLDVFVLQGNTLMLFLIGQMLCQKDVVVYMVKFNLVR